MRVVEEREDKFQVDTDWGLPKLAGFCRTAAALINRCASSTTPTSTRQVLVYGCLGSRCGVASEDRRRAGS